LLAIQKDGVRLVHEDPITKSKRVTDISGNILSTVELDPWGADTAKSNQSAFQPKKFTSYERDGNGSDEAMFRRYNRWHSRFDQPDPYEGSYDSMNPQSFNRYSYTQNDPVNFTDPSGLDGEFTCTPGDPMCALGTVTVYGSYGGLLGGSGSGLGVSDSGQFLDIDLGNFGARGTGNPQNPTPTLKDAIDSARKALEADQCKSLFSKGNGLETLNKLVKDKKLKIGDTGVPRQLSPTGRLKDAPGLGEIEKGGRVFLNPSSSVMKGTYPYDSPTAAFGGLSPTNALAALIIHGVLHVTKDIEPDGTSPNDSLIHNADVARSCFPKPNP
jgi:RHS repeat-associated protein